MNNLFETSHTDPFNFTKPPAHLVNISTRAIASPEIERSMTWLTNLSTKGLYPKMAVPKRVSTHHFPEANLRLPDMSVEIKVNKKSIAADNKTVYLHLMAINTKKKVPLLHVMSFENTNVPLSIFLENESMNLPKEGKVQYGNKLEGLLQQKTTTMSAADCVIYDMNCVVHLLPFHGEKFEEIASSYKNTIFQTNLKIGYRCVNQTHLIFDR